MVLGWNSFTAADREASCVLEWKVTNAEIESTSTGSSGYDDLISCSERRSVDIGGNKLQIRSGTTGKEGIDGQRIPMSIPRNGEGCSSDEVCATMSCSHRT